MTEVRTSAHTMSKELRDNRGNSHGKHLADVSPLEGRGRTVTWEKKRRRVKGGKRAL